MKTCSNDKKGTSKILMAKMEDKVLLGQKRNLPFYDIVANFDGRKIDSTTRISSLPGKTDGSLSGAAFFIKEQVN
jgi:hypothetical protein